MHTLMHWCVYEYAMLCLRVRIIVYCNTIFHEFYGLQTSIVVLPYTSDCVVICSFWSAGYHYSILTHYIEIGNVSKCWWWCIVCSETDRLPITYRNCQYIVLQHFIVFLFVNWCSLVRLLREMEKNLHLEIDLGCMDRFQMLYINFGPSEY